MIAAIIASLLIQGAAQEARPSPASTSFDPELPVLDVQTTLGLVRPFHACASPLVAEYVGRPTGQRNVQTDGAFIVSLFNSCPATQVLDLAYQAHRRANPELTEERARQAATQDVSLAMLGPILNQIVQTGSVVEPPIPPCRFPDGSIGPCQRQ